MAGAELGSGPEVGALRRRLLAWYRRERRDLPWRASRDPYRVWVSEVMLQQTRVEVVAPRFEAFLEKFPTLRALARAREEEVLAAWSGLGYYRRARNLHASAARIIEEHAGVFPRERAKALELPGVGVYIAHAVLSIAYGAPLAVVDGNVARVLSRLGRIAARSPAALQAEADRLLDPRFPGDANQALMELGATVCTPLSPRCDRCPLRLLCAARAAGRVADFPPATRRPRAECVETSLWIALDHRSRIWIEKRETPPLSGIWMLPWRETYAGFDGAREVGVLRHAVMNRRYRCTVLLTRRGPGTIPGLAAGPGRWATRVEIDALPRSSLLMKGLALWDAERGKRSGRDAGAQPRS